MSKSAALLVLLHISGSFACSCFDGGVIPLMCHERTANIISVKIDAIIWGEKPTVSWRVTDPPNKPTDNSTTTPTTSVPLSNTPNYSSSRRIVSATVLSIFKGADLAPGDTIEVESEMSDAMCGVGHSLTPGREMMLTTGPNPTKVYANLCEMMTLDGGERVRKILENNECECSDRRRCKLQIGRRVFRGKCRDRGAWCARDRKGVCRWYNAESIASCSKHWWE